MINEVVCISTELTDILKLHNLESPCKVAHSKHLVYLIKQAQSMLLSTNPKQWCVLEHQAKTEEISPFFPVFYLPAYSVSKAQ